MLNSIIEKLKKEHGKNGVYYVLEDALKRLTEEQIEREFLIGDDTKIPQFLNTCNKIREEERFIQGLLYGLLGAEFITKEELDKAIESIS